MKLLAGSVLLSPGWVAWTGGAGATVDGRLPG
jgi:hypothetical protein